MNHVHLKAKMDAFFKKDPAETLIKKFEELGYEFERKKTHPKQGWVP